MTYPGREGSRPRDPSCAEPRIDPMKRWIMPTLQTGSRRAGTRALPRWGRLTRLESRENDR
jgi:hypothetical protein